MEPLAARPIDVLGSGPALFLHPDDVQRMGLHAGEWVRVTMGAQPDAPALVHATASLVAKGEAGLSQELQTQLGGAPGEPVTLALARRATSVQWIRRKLDGGRLDAAQIESVVKDISRGAFTAIEVTAWASALQVHGMDTDEIVSYVNAMVAGGERIRFRRGPVMDVHSIGGVPGNKYAPIAVPIVASHGLLIPKTSSRAISSACGTADFMEVVTPVALSSAQIQKITEEVGGVLAWGGGVQLAPADDAIIRVEYPLALDPKAQLIASVLSKKVAVGATDVLIDLPVGDGAKVLDEAAARSLAHDFITVGERVGLKVQVSLSKGSQPVGRAIGPVLEIREALQVLEGDTGPEPLIDKACTFAGRLLEMGGAAKMGEGKARARETLADGRALAKFREIIGAQGGNPDVRAADLEPGPHALQLHTYDAGLVVGVHNPDLVQVARAAGSPRDQGAGLLLGCQPGDRVAAGDTLYTIFAEHRHRLEAAAELARKLRPFRIEGGEVMEIMG
ncbi:MAG: AMP phosphorylase [Thermoplasmatota archaeon]